MSDPWQEVYEIGYNAAVSDCIAAVRAECYHDDPTEWCVFAAALEALQEKP